MTIQRKLPRLEAAVSEQSWAWLRENEPIFADALRDEVAAGATPDEIHYFIMRQTQRAPLALRLRQAAEYLTHEGGA